MASETAVPRSRRALLAASLGGLVALLTQALGRPAPARAGGDGDVVLGLTNTATTTTAIQNTSSGATVFRADGSTAIGVHGSSGSNTGVRGESTSGSGVVGTSDSSAGVWGSSQSHHAVIGVNAAATLAATVGQSYAHATGLLGYSGAAYDSLPTAPAKTGVYGYAVQDAASRGVWGRSGSGRGVYG